MVMKGFVTLRPIRAILSNGRTIVIGADEGLCTDRYDREAMEEALKLIRADKRLNGPGSFVATLSDEELVSALTARYRYIPRSANGLRDGALHIEELNTPW